MQGAEFALLELEGDAPCGRIDCLDDARAGRRPAVAERDVHTVVAQFGHLEEVPQCQTVQFGGSRRVDAAARSGQSRGIVAHRERPAGRDGTCCAQRSGHCRVAAERHRPLDRPAAPLVEKLLLALAG